MKRTAIIPATDTTPGARFEHDIVDPHPSGWVFLHRITKRFTVAGPNGQVPPAETELVAGIPPHLATFVTFEYEEVPNVIG